MPISRYEVRNEYALADPELYRAADKDDPEALLEGAAVAGLVGVLRLLGDLAEFSAEIFHNLHEEVMATAARGHSLMSRIQQLETEIPLIERAFLSQTDHSSYFKRPVIDWHPYLRVDQNIVTKGDLPRFVRDSYEECRPPPRLFLLDKFDVGGAGACLKRYTDPSFFKVEPSGMTKADVTRDKKIRKPKKKEPRSRNGETPSVLPSTSHTKLHELFMEERIAGASNHPTCRAKLKRKLNGFPFDMRTETSYMEKLLNYPPLDNEVVSNVSLNSSLFLFPTFDHNESGLEKVEVLPVGLDREAEGRKRSPPSSPDGDEIMLSSSIYRSGEVTIDDSICEVPDMYPNNAAGRHLSTPDWVVGEKVIAMDGECSLNGYQSEDVTSEVEHYVDAPSTAESDADADSQLQVEGARTTSHIKNESLISYASSESENLQTGSSDSRSMESDEANIASMKEKTILSSDTPSTSYENTRPERISAEGFLTADVPEAENFPVHSHSEIVTGEGMLERAAYGKMGSKLENESMHGVYTVPYMQHHTENSLNRVTSSLLGWGGSNQEDQISLENGTRNEIIYSGNEIPGKSVDEFENLLKRFPSKHPDIVNGENIESTISVEKNPFDILDDNECFPGLQSESSNQFPRFMETLLRNKLEEESLENARFTNAEDIHSNSSIDNRDTFENLVFSGQANSSDWPNAGSGALEGDVIPEQDNPINEARALKISGIWDVVGPDELKEPTGTPDIVEMDIIAHSKSFNGKEVTESSCLDDLISLDEVQVQLNEYYLGADKSSNVDCPSQVDTNQLVEQHINLLEESVDDIEHVKNSPSRKNGESKLVEKVDQTKTALPDSENEENGFLPGHQNQMSREFPVTLSANNQQALSHDDFPQDQFMSIYPTNNPFLDTNEINLADLPPLPPLPPVQWRLGKPQPAWPSSEGDFSKHEPSFSLLFTHPAMPTDDVTSYGDHPLHEEMKEPLMRFHENDRLEVEKVEESFCAQVNAGRGMVDPSLKSQNKQQDLILSISGCESTLAAEEDENADSRQEGELPKPMIEGGSREEVFIVPQMVDFFPKTENKQLGLVVLASRDGSSLSAEEDVSGNGSRAGELPQSLSDDGSCTEVNPICETGDHLPESENKQQESVVLAAEDGPTSAAMEGGSGNGRQAGKLPQPLIEKVSRTEVNPIGQMVDLLPKSENKQEELVVPASGDGPTSAAKEDGSENWSRAEKLSQSLIERGSHIEVNPIGERADLLPKSENKQEELVVPASGDGPTSAAKEDGSENWSRAEKLSQSLIEQGSHIEVNPIGERADLLPESENNQEELVVPVSGDWPTSAAREDGSENGSRAGKLPPSLIEEGSRIEVNPIGETVDLLPESENKHEELVVPASGDGPRSEAREDGSENGNGAGKLPQSLIEQGSRTEINPICETVDFLPKNENKKPELVVPASAPGVGKLPLPHNPLINEFTGLDKIKLRKVTERARPQVPKVGERDSLLEQIRTKSFNLRPPSPSRPRIHGPSTNLRVAAIVEKANAIRQALADSDEDGDSWSDS